MKYKIIKVKNLKPGTSIRINKDWGYFYISPYSQHFEEYLVHFELQKKTLTLCGETFVGVQEILDIF